MGDYFGKPAKQFVITPDHLTLLQRTYVSWDDCEFGAPGIDPKRPYGNSDVQQDICSILGWNKMNAGDEDCEYADRQLERASEIHKELKTVLQIVLSVGRVEPGEYVSTDDICNRTWVQD